MGNSNSSERVHQLPKLNNGSFGLHPYGLELNFFPFDYEKFPYFSSQIIPHPPTLKFISQHLQFCKRDLKKSQKYGYFKKDSAQKPKNETLPLRSIRIAPEGSILRTPSDRISTVVDMVEYTVLLNFYSKCFGTRRKDADGNFSKYFWRTYGEVGTIIKSFAKGIRILNLCPLQTFDENEEVEQLRILGLFSKNREEWAMADLAAGFIKTTTVPLYDTLGQESLIHIIDQTKMQTCVIAQENLISIFNLKKIGMAKTLKNIIIMEPITEELKAECATFGMNLTWFWDIAKIGNENSQDLFEYSSPDDLATICYTSGTTGLPKGVCLTHANYVSEMATIYFDEIIHLGKESVYLSYLPLAHVFERTVFNQFLLIGGQIGFYNGNILKLTDDLQELKPNIIISVPRLFNRFYDVINSKIKDLPNLKRHMVWKAIQAKIDKFRKTGVYTHSLYDPLIFKKMKSLLGGKIQLMVSGAAPIAQEVLEMLSVCFSCSIREGYGQTETCAAICCTASNDLLLGHVGPPCATTEIKLVDVPELNYFSTDMENGKSQPRGEICIRGSTIFSKYFRDPNKTAETIDKDGWLHTGDVGTILEGGRIKIIDRVKNMFKLAQGEYIAVEKLENIYIKSPFISQLFVYGDSLQHFLVAIIVPEPQELQRWANENSIQKTNEELCKDHRLLQAVLEDISKLGKSAKLYGFEIVKKVFLTMRPFSVEDQTMTPTFKVKRNEAKKMYLREITEMYASI